MYIVIVFGLAFLLAVVLLVNQRVFMLKQTLDRHEREIQLLRKQYIALIKRMKETETDLYEIPLESYGIIDTEETSDI